MIPHPLQRAQPRGPQGDDRSRRRFGIALVVFVLASSLMLSAGIRKTLGASGKADNAIVLRKGSDAELGSVDRGVERARSSSRRPA